MTRKEIELRTKKYAEMEEYPNGIIVAIPYGMDMIDAYVLIGNLRVRLQEEINPARVIIQPGVNMIYALKTKIKGEEYLKKFLEMSLEHGNLIIDVCVFS